MKPFFAILVLLDVSPRPATPAGVAASWTFCSTGEREERTGRKLELVDARTTREGLVISKGYAVSKDAKLGAVTGALTIETWAKFDKFNYAWAIIVARGATGRSIGEGYGLYVGQRGEIYFTVAGRAVQAGVDTVKMGEWTHLVMTAQSDTGKLTAFVNGREVVSGDGPAGGAPDTGGPIYVGGSDIVPCHVEFTMRTLRIYGRVLPLRDIQQLAKRK